MTSKLPPAKRSRTQSAGATAAAAASAAAQKRQLSGKTLAGQPGAAHCSQKNNTTLRDYIATLHMPCLQPQVMSFSSKCSAARMTLSMAQHTHYPNSPQRAAAKLLSALGLVKVPQGSQLKRRPAVCGPPDGKGRAAKGHSPATMKQPERVAALGCLHSSRGQGKAAPVLALPRPQKQQQQQQVHHR
jgi:hypothetical protein